MHNTNASMRSHFMPTWPYVFTSGIQDILSQYWVYLYEKLSYLPFFHDVLTNLD